MKIFIDTNWFLAFYQSSKEPAAVLDDLLRRADRIILPEQTINEVRRNRGNLISVLRKNLAASVAIKPYTTSALQALPEFTRLLEASERFQSAAKSTLAAIDAMNSATDLIAAAFDSLVNECSRIWITPEIVAAAHARKGLRMRNFAAFVVRSL